MCVIMVCGEKRPTPDLVEKAWNHNDHGGGVAWREQNDKNETIVRWEKGLSKEEMHEYCKTLPFPFIAHFRIASTGGRAEDLCHPFEIGPRASAKLSGVTPKGVLFHNGTWSQWRSIAMDLAINRNIKVPPGPWNDTRTMAWVTAHLGEGILEFINEKTVLFGPKTFSIFGDGWEEVEGIPMSNKIFLNSFRSKTGNQSGNGTVAHNVQGQVQSRANLLGSTRPDITVITEAETAGGLSQGITFRGSIEVVSSGETVEEQVEEGTEGTSSASSSSVQSPKGQKVVVEMGPRPVKDLSDKQAKAVSLWASSQNPKRFSGHTPIAGAPIVEADLEDADRHRRIDAARRGISYLGRI